MNALVNSPNTPPTSSSRWRAAASEVPISPSVKDSFDRVYAETASFVWTNARRLGIHPSNIEDVVQDVFLVVHRRLGEFEERSSARTWVFGIMLNVINDHKRRFRRKESKNVPPPTSSETDLAGTGPNPENQAATRESLSIVQNVLEAMSEEKRIAFVLSQMEGLTVPEIAEITGESATTLYGRVRLARAEFETLVNRMYPKGSVE